MQDPFEKNVPGMGLGRDPERTPMQWDGSPNAGFTTGTPWLPLAPDAGTVNVAAQRDDPGSMLALYRRLIRLRRAEPALAVDSYEPVPAGEDLVAYLRREGERQFLIVLNLGSQPREFAAPGSTFSGRVALSTHPDRDGAAVTTPMALRADEGIVVELSPTGR